MKKSMFAAVALSAVFVGCGPSNESAANAAATPGKPQAPSGSSITLSSEFIQEQADKANGSALAMKGGALYNAILACNIERAMSGYDSVWPHAADEVSGDPDDIAGRTYRSATEYFKVLLDFDNKGTEDWDSYLGELDPDIALANGRSKWSIAVGLDDEADERIPLLVSRNLDCAKLTEARRGKADLDAVIPVYNDAMLQTSCVVIVRKGGAVQVLEPRQVTLRNILDGLAPGALPASYLAP